MATRTLPQSSEFVIRMVLGPSGGRIVRTINQWISESGIEWTVNRLKSLRTAALQLRAGNHEMAKEIYQKNSIGYYRTTLIPRGPYEQVFTLFLKAQRPGWLRALESVLRVYTSLKLTSVSEKQANKAKTAITTPYQGDDQALKEYEELIVGWVKENLVPGILVPNRLVDRNGKPVVTAPNLQRLKAFSSSHRGKVRTSGFRDQPYGMATLSLATTSCWPQAFGTSDGFGDFVGGYYPTTVARFIQSICFATSTDNESAGHITFIQEGGAKGRVVAVPTAWLSWGFEPLHNWLDHVLKHMPASCVHDHNSGGYWLRQHLDQGNTLWCYDLSSATDRFPLSLQLTLLRALKLDEFADALEEIVMETWLVSDGPYKGELWNYACGQPMGLYGSFTLFTLCHIAILDALCAKLGLDTLDPPYRVIGDDVIILSSMLASAYAAFLTSCGLEFSPTKTVKSDRVAEFAGFVGYRTNRSVAVFRPYKHGSTKYLHNPVNLLHSLGGKLRRTGSPYWARKVYEYQLTKAWRNPDLSPLISDQDGLEGVNPQVIDTSRLSNLLWAALAHSGVSRNTFTGEDYTLESLEDLAEILLDQEHSIGEDLLSDGGRKPLSLLATPEPGSDDESDHPTNWEKSLKADPLMSDVVKGRLPSAYPDQLVTKTEPVKFSSGCRWQIWKG